MTKLNIVTASNNEQVLIDNLMKSDIYDKYKVHVRTGFTNIPKAYNTIQDEETEMTMYVHNDVWINKDFEKELDETLKYLPDDWGVLGVAGVRLNQGKRTCHGHINDRGRIWGHPIGAPSAYVQTLDELLLIVNNKHKCIKFDEQFELDFYGADACMQANANKLGVYVFPGYVHHNSQRPFGNRTESFFESQKKFEEKWKEQLPIATTCAIMQKK